jgi:hypothetical protein
MNEQTNTTKEIIRNEETIEEINENSNAEQTKLEESGSASGETKPEQVDFSQIHDMLTQRDNEIKDLKGLISELKKTNTELLLKVNASSSGAVKNPYEAFVDSMAMR